MKEISFLLIGQSHSFHFFSLVNYLDNFLNELEGQKTDTKYKVYILPSYPYDWGTNEKVLKKNTLRMYQL